MRGQLPGGRNVGPPKESGDRPPGERPSEDQAMLTSAIKKVSIALMVSVLISTAFACTATRPQPDASEPDTRAATIQRLQKAEATYRGNSQSFTRSDPSLDHYYRRKTKEVHSLIQELQRGQEVPPEEIATRWTIARRTSSASRSTDNLKCPYEALPC
jgi:hypothetical protein